MVTAPAPTPVAPGDPSAPVFFVAALMFSLLHVSHFTNQALAWYV